MKLLQIKRLRLWLSTWLKNEPNSTRRSATRIIGLSATAYFLMAMLGLTLSFEHTNASPVWPAAGIGLLMLLEFGPVAALGIALGAAIANTLGFLDDFNLWQALLLGGFISIGNSLEALAGWTLIRKWTGERDFVGNPRDALVFVAITPLVALVSALNGPAIVSMALGLDFQTYLEILIIWFIGDMAGIILLAPLWTAYRTKVPAVGIPRLEYSLFWLALVLVLALRFAADVSIVAPNIPLLAAILGWGAIRFMRFQAALAGLVVTTVAILFTINGRGPFAGPQEIQSLITLQLFVIVIASLIWVMGGLGFQLRTKQQKLQEQVEARTIELQFKADRLVETNNRLENFISIVSHDIKGPLRRIYNFTLIMIEQCQPDHNRDCEDLGDRILRNAREGQEMIASLVNYSRLDVEVNFATVDIGSVVRTVISDLQGEYPHTKIKVETLFPVIEADVVLIRQLFYNLIGNALKFSAEVPEPVVSVSYRREGDNHVFWVEDNGVGIPLESQALIFEIFKRAHSQARYPGSGIGLAVCKRVVGIHNGSMEVESASGQGAKFIIRLSA